MLLQIKSATFSILCNSFASCSYIHKRENVLWLKLEEELLLVLVDVHAGAADNARLET